MHTTLWYSKNLEEFWMEPIKHIELITYYYFLLFQEARITSIIAFCQQTGQNDLVKEQQERIDWIRKIAKDYSEGWEIKKCATSEKLQ